MSEEKRVDIKYYIQPEVKEWYRNQIESFYVVITDYGEILHFSEDSLDFFNIVDSSVIDDYALASFIGSSNWDFLLENIVAHKEQTLWLALPEAVIPTCKLRVKWNSFSEREDTFHYFLLFTKIIEEQQLPFFPEIVNHVQIPMAVIINDTITYTNGAFDILIINLSIHQLTDIKTWLSESTEAALFFEQRENDFSIQLFKEEHDYIISGKWYSEIPGAWTLTILRREVEHIQTIVTEITPKEVEELPIEDEGGTLQEQNNQPSINLTEKRPSERLLQEIVTIKTETESILESVLALIKEESSESTGEVTKKFAEYRTIIRNTSENLLKMSEIAQFIEDISTRIHLISINAAIESARTGEMGKGFAVIAREIRKLSDATNNYTKMIGTEIENIRIYTESISLTEQDSTLQDVASVESTYSERVLSIVESIRTNVVDSLTSLINE